MDASYHLAQDQVRVSRHQRTRLLSPLGDRSVLTPRLRQSPRRRRAPSQLPCPPPGIRNHDTPPFLPHHRQNRGAGAELLRQRGGCDRLAVRTLRSPIGNGGRDRRQRETRSSTASRRLLASMVRNGCWCNSTPVTMAQMPGCKNRSLPANV